MISIERSSATPAYVQLYEGLREDIVRGIYEPDAKLPSVRYVAEELGVSRNTVDKAYQQLYAEGYVVSRNRSGYYVDPAVLPGGFQRLFRRVRVALVARISERLSWPRPQRAVLGRADCHPIGNAGRH